MRNTLAVRSEAEFIMGGESFFRERSVRYLARVIEEAGGAITEIFRAGETIILALAVAIILACECAPL